LRIRCGKVHGCVPLSAIERMLLLMLRVRLRMLMLRRILNGRRLLLR
jgi:hypothetical protein